VSGFFIALAGFVLLHIGVSATGLRPAIIGRIGLGAYRIAFALASIGLLVWMIQAYGVMRGDPFDPLNERVWAPPAWLRWPADTLVLAGFLFAISGLVTRSPAMAGNERALAKPEPARGMLRITRHPFLWGVAFWSAGHVLVNGERFAPMLFGALGLMALYGTRSIDRKGRARDPEAWARFEGATSNLPFAAIVQGRNRLALGEMIPGLLAGLAVFAIVGFLHERLFGAPAF
jgi:uncharacterized membrane protein